VGEGKPKRQRKPRKKAAGVDALRAVAKLAAALSDGGAAGAAVDPGRACVNCGHARREHCGCGQTCRWHGPPVAAADGPVTALCACVGFKAALPPIDDLPLTFDSDGGPFGPILDLLGLRRDK